MRNVVFSLVFIMFLAIPVKAQNFVDEAYVDMRGGFEQAVSSDSWNKGFHVNYLNIHVKGHVSESVTYTFRHRLTKPVYDKNNPLNATDFAWLTWQATPKFSLTAGKQPVWFGTYEFDADPIDIFCWSHAIADLWQYYTLGLSATYEVAPSQNLYFQISQSPLSLGITDCFSYSIYWNGSFAPWWHTTWSTNFVDSEPGIMAGYLVLGNRFNFGRFLIDADFIAKTSFSRGLFEFPDDTGILLAKYQMDKLNLCLKGVWDYNSASNILKDRPGTSWDVVVPAGTDIKQISAGVEYFPLSNKNIRLHAFYGWASNMENVHIIETGLTWRFDLCKRN